MPEQLKIIGIVVDSRAHAEDAVEQLEDKVDAGAVTVREVCLVYRSERGKLKVRYLHSHAMVLGAAVGTVSAAVAVATAVATSGGAILPLLVGCVLDTGIDVGVGAAIGRAVERRRRQVTTDFARNVADAAGSGRAAVLVAADPTNAEILLTDVRTTYPEVLTLDLPAEKQHAIAQDAIAVS